VFHLTQVACSFTSKISLIFWLPFWCAKCPEWKELNRQLKRLKWVQVHGHPWNCRICHCRWQLGHYCSPVLRIPGYHCPPHACVNSCNGGSWWQINTCLLFLKTYVSAGSEKIPSWPTSSLPYPIWKEWLWAAQIHPSQCFINVHYKNMEVAFDKSALFIQNLSWIS
jgi:hypothetical protein